MTGQTEWRAMGHPPTHVCSRRLAPDFIIIARFVTWSNRCALLYLLHQ